MYRAVFPNFLLAFSVYAATDYFTQEMALRLEKAIESVTFWFISQSLNPFLPFILAGLVAGYTGNPRGFPIGFTAAFFGSLWSATWRNGISWSTILADTNMTVSTICWSLGTALACGVCGWAGERLREKIQSES